MRKRFWSTLYLILCGISVSGHPLHVSVTNISLEGKSLNITINTFVDDWETAYFHYYGSAISFREPENRTNKWLTDYLHASLSIKTDPEETALEMLIDSISFDDLSMKLELHAKLTEIPKTLYIYNSILTDIYADQTNLLIFSAEGRQKGIKFDYHKQEEALKLR